ncbi:MAG TPA: NADH-quinone oxidoreductase subunit L, partial [Aquifex aeolicus]|nr:NADH-quinone oxidoreductase subunit L [Aquifex aeolicus]
YLTYSKSLYTTFERLFIDGLVNSTYLIVQLLANIFKFFQIGRLNWYVLSLGAGLTMIVFILLVITIRGGL